MSGTARPEDDIARAAVRPTLFGHRVFRDLWAGSVASSIGSSAGT